MMRKTVRFAAATVGIAAMTVVLACAIASWMLPDTFSVVAGKQLSFAGRFPVTTEKKTGGAVQANASLKAGDVYSTELSLFGVVPIKQVTVDVVNETDVIPGGQPFGIKLTTEGVMVVGMSDVDTSSGPKNPAYNAGIRIGDIILAVNGKTVSGNDDVEKAFLDSNGKPVKISFKRDTVAYNVTVTPVKSANESTYKAGIWVRDSTAGIGTLTFFCPGSGVFAGLGHGICDVDTGEIMPLSQGDIVHASISGIAKGQKGQPGELKGFFLSELRWGALNANTETGVYGTMDGFPQGKAIPVAMKQQVHTGPAEIYTTLNGSTPQKFSVVIEKVHFNDNAATKNMVVRVTDKSLLAQTGGIVQGMSGSPIIQDGKLVGAVTHVFVNDPTHGYGIFAENMIKTAKGVEIAYQKDVS